MKTFSIYSQVKYSHIFLFLFLLCCLVPILCLCRRNLQINKNIILLRNDNVLQIISPYTSGAPGDKVCEHAASSVNMEPRRIER